MLVDRRTHRDDASSKTAGRRVEAVLFDYGLVLTGPPDPAAWATMLNVTGVPDEVFRRSYWAPRHEYDRGTYTGEEYWREVGVGAGLHLSDTQLSELIDADASLWTQPNPPMVDWAARLQLAGIRTGILSNLGDAMTAGVLGRAPWLAGFDDRLWSHTLKLAKPERAIYEHAVRRLRVPPEHILFVDDREDNVAGARGAGMEAIQYREHTPFVQEMEQRGWGDLWRVGRKSDLVAAVGE